MDYDRKQGFTTLNISTLAEREINSTYWDNKAIICLEGNI